MVRWMNCTVYLTINTSIVLLNGSTWKFGPRISSTYALHFTKKNLSPTEIILIRMQITFIKRLSYYEISRYFFQQVAFYIFKILQLQCFIADKYIDKPRVLYIYKYYLNMKNAFPIALVHDNKYEKIHDNIISLPLRHRLPYWNDNRRPKNRIK